MISVYLFYFTEQPTVNLNPAFLELGKKLSSVTANLSCLIESPELTSKPYQQPLLEPQSDLFEITRKKSPVKFFAVNFKRVQKRHHHPPVSFPKKSLNSNSHDPNAVNRNESLHRAKSRSLSDFFSSNESSPINRLLSILCKEKEAEKMMNSQPHSVRTDAAVKTKPKPTTTNLSSSSKENLSTLSSDSSEKRKPQTSLKNNSNNVQENENERLETRKRITSSKLATSTNNTHAQTSAIQSTVKSKTAKPSTAVSRPSTTTSSSSKSVRSTSSAKSSDESAATNKPIRTTKASRLRAGKNF